MVSNPSLRQGIPPKTGCYLLCLRPATTGAQAEIPATIAAPEQVFGSTAVAALPATGDQRMTLHLDRRQALAAGLSAAAGTLVPASASLSASAEGPAGASGPPVGSLPLRHRVWQLGSDQRGPGSLEQVERTLAAPAPDEVVVEVLASALNNRDLQLLRQAYGPAQPAERIPVGDGAGVVVAVGAQVEGITLGQRVTAPHFVSWLDGAYRPEVFAADLGITRDGWLAEYITLPAAALVPVPESMSFEQAAALGAAGITAWRVLVEFAGLRAGDTVLALGTGGVATLGLQIARMHGARVAITSSSDDKLAVARELGAEITVNYRNEPDWDRAVLEATGGRGVDIVLETVGFGTLPQSLRCCAPNGRIGVLGSLDPGGDRVPNLSTMLLRNLRVEGVTSGSRRMLAELLQACAVNGISPHIDRRFGFDEAREALEYLAGGEHVGKVVISS